MSRKPKKPGWFQSICNFLLWIFQCITPSQTIQISKYNVCIKNFDKQLYNLCIVQLSDFHYDENNYSKQRSYVRLPNKLLEQAIEITNNQNPDLILLTGDFVHYDYQPIAKLVQELKKLKCKYGIFASLGNHDYKVNNAQYSITKALENACIKVLSNQKTVVVNDQIELVGIIDRYHPEYWKFKSMKFMQNSSDKFRIVLAHNPDTFDDLLNENWKFNLQLSGHSHGGQIALPNHTPVLHYLNKLVNRFPIWLKRIIPKQIMHWISTIKNWNYGKGFHRIEQNGITYYLNVNRGLGSHPPGRLFCSPEVSVITLTK